MNSTPVPSPRDKFRRFVLTILAIAILPALFLLMLSLTSNAGMRELPQILISICVPPAVLSALAGIYFLLHPGVKADND